MTTRKPRATRSNLTDAERKLWSRLRVRQVHGFSFRRQRPVSHFIVDFVCQEGRLIIEVEGSQYAQKAAQVAHRDDYLTDLGFKVLRFWDNSVLDDIDAVIEEIAQALEEQTDPHPDLPPLAGEGATGSSIRRFQEQP